MMKSNWKSHLVSFLYWLIKKLKYTVDCYFYTSYIQADHEILINSSRKCVRDIFCYLDICTYVYDDNLVLKYYNIEVDIMLR